MVVRAHEQGKAMMKSIRQTKFWTRTALVGAERVRSEYVEEVTDQELMEAAINGMLTSLDPHSSFLNSKSFRDMRVQTKGEFGGLGIEVSMENGLVKVVSPIDDTPAAKAGLGPGGREDAWPGRFRSDHLHPARFRGAVRRHPDPRGHQDPFRALPGNRQCRLYPYHHLQRANHDRPGSRDREDQGREGRSAHRLRDRSAQQSGRIARRGDLGFRCLPGAGRDRVHPWPRPGERLPRSRQARRPD